MDICEKCLKNEKEELFCRSEEMNSLEMLSELVIEKVNPHFIKQEREKNSRE